MNKRIKLSIALAMQMALFSQANAVTNPSFPWSSSTHNEVQGDFNGDNKTDSFVQSKLKSGTSGLMPTATSVNIDSPIYRNWAGAHPQISAIKDWSARSYSAQAANLNSAPGDELLLLGQRQTVLIHSEIITPVRIHPSVKNAIISWDTSGNASYSEIDLKIDADDYQVTFADLNGDGYSEIFIQSEKSNKASYIINGDGSISQTLNNGYLGVDWSTQSTLSFVDENGDGRMDIRITDSNGNVSIIYADINGEYNTYPESSAPGWGVKSDAIVADDSDYFKPTLATQESVGAVEGSGGVSGGSSTYNIPIALPPGRSGMQPSVSLSYSSKGGNGIAGMGWGLSAGSSISRCSQTQAQDGKTLAVSYSSQDKLCLDGKRLIVTSGTYGATGSVYRTEMDSFAKVTLTGSIGVKEDGEFVVQYKNGRKAFFGNTAETKFYAEGIIKVKAWALSKVEDVVGNYMTYNYTDEGEGEYTLESIDYTGFGETEGTRHVEFSYDTREDVATSYHAGGKSRSTKRLTSIQTKLGSKVIREYILEYDYSLSTSRSLLKSVQECSQATGTNKCLTPTTFDWLEKKTQYSFERMDTFGQPNGWQERRLHKHLPHADYNGDGVKDWPKGRTDAEGRLIETYSDKTANCYRPQNGFSMVCLQGDFDNDGITDEFQKVNGLLKIKMSSSSSSTWQATEINWQAANHTFKPSAAGYPMSFSDFNGDGWTDIAFFHPYYPSPELRIYFHTQNTNAPFTDSSSQLVSTYNVESSGVGWNSGGYGIVVGDYVMTTDIQPYGDMDGNGLEDFVVFSIDHSYPSLPIPQYILLNNGSAGFTTREFAGRLESGQQRYKHGDIFEDINGDGLTDWLSIGKDRGFDVFAKLNIGTGFESEWRDLGFRLPFRGGPFTDGCTLDPVNSSQCVPYIFQMPAMTKIVMMDYDGDGKREFLKAKDIIASSCIVMRGFGGTSGWKCDDGVYQTYQPSGGSFQNIGVNDSDETVRTYDVIFIDEATDGTLSSRIVADPALKMAATQHAVIDAFGNGLTDVVSVLGCRWDDVPESSTYGCKWNTATSHTGAEQDTDLYEGIYILRNKGAANKMEEFQPIDKIKIVRDGLGRENRWIYKPLGTGTYQTTGDTSVPESERKFYHTDHSYQESDPEYFHFASSMMVVAEELTSNGVGGHNSTRYRYRGAMYNTEGRGFQGFRQIIVDNMGPVERLPLGNEDSPLDSIYSSDNASYRTRAVTDFHQKFPAAGKIEEARTCTLDINNPFCITNPLSRTQVQYAKLTTANSKVHWVVPAKTQKTERGLNNTSELSKTVSYLGHSDPDEGAVEPLSDISLGTDTYDKYGNVLISTQEVDSGYGKQVVTTTTAYHAANESTWWINKVKDTSVTTSKLTATELGTAWAANDSSLDKVRTVKTTLSDYQYRKPKNVSTTVSAGGGQSSEVTTVLNAYGQPTVVKTKHPTETNKDRYVNTTYNTSDNYFVASVSNALGHTTYFTNYPEHGQNKTTTDANGITTTSVYDPFGRIEAVSVSNLPTAYKRYISCDECDSVIHAKYKVVGYQNGSPSTVIYKDQFNRDIESRTTAFDGDSSIRTFKTFDGFGRTMFESKPHGLDSTAYGTSFDEYDELGRVKKRTTTMDTAAANMEVTYTYDGHKTTVIANDITMYRWHSGTGQLMQTEDAKGGTVTYAYDGMGNPVVLKDAKGATIKATYNALGQKEWVEDPNMGTKVFSYSPFGEVRSERDANDDTTLFEYDILGRMVKRKVNNDDEATFSFDTALKGNSGDVCLGLPHVETRDDLLSHENFSHSSGYDNMCRPVTSTTMIDDVAYTMSTQYDSVLGRTKAVTYPNGLTVAYGYTTLGYLEKTYNPVTNFVYRKFDKMDSLGNWTEASLNNGSMDVKRDFDMAGGHMKSSELMLNSTRHQYLKYQSFDNFGNLTSYKVENLINGELETDRESFAYDDLHRLTQSNRTFNNGTTDTIDYGYDKVGNLLMKTDYTTSTLSSMQYNGVDSVRSSANGWAGPNAVRHVVLKSGGTRSYTYDLNGNLIGDGVKSITYNAFNKPVKIEQGLTTIGFSYGANQMRYKQVKYKDGIQTKTLYIGKVFEKTTKNNSSEVVTKTYLDDIAVITESAVNSEMTQKIGYFHRDRLGSMTATVDDSNQVLGRHSFDPFGKPRDGKLQDKEPGILGSDVTTRGFTGHEHLDDIELIHMNGRAYDYNLGRFLSVDPFIQAPGNSQSMNPYSYVMNNPLAGTDPSGYTSEVAGRTRSICERTGGNSSRCGGTRSQRRTTHTAAYKNGKGENVVATIVTKGNTSKKSIDELSEKDIVSASQTTFGSNYITSITMTKVKITGGTEAPWRAPQAGEPGYPGPPFLGPDEFIHSSSDKSPSKYEIAQTKHKLSFKVAGWLEMALDDKLVLSGKVKLSEDFTVGTDVSGNLTITSGNYEAQFKLNEKDLKYLRTISKAREFDYGFMAVKAKVISKGAIAMDFKIGAPKKWTQWLSELFGGKVEANYTFTTTYTIDDAKKFKHLNNAIYLKNRSEHELRKINHF